MAGPTVKVLQFEVSAASLAEHARDIIADGYAGQGRWVCTFNLEMLGRALHDPAYGELLGGVGTFVADGASILMLSKLLNGEAPEGRTTGVDLVKRLLEAQDSAPIGIVGGRAPERALDALDVPRGRVSYMNSRVIALDAESLDRLAAEISAAACGIVLVALGVPNQDVVCAHLRRRLPHVVLVGVGGSFEILGGLKRRAPRWLQDAGFEWLFRLCQEPRRLARRYLLFYPTTVARLARTLSRGRVQG